MNMKKFLLLLGAGATVTVLFRLADPLKDTSAVDTAKKFAKENADALRETSKKLAEK